MALNFPTSPALNDEYTFETKTWVWNGTAWALKQNAPTVLLDIIKTVDGAGSGLDADVLDGNNSSAFYLASNPSGYTTNTGDVVGPSSATDNALVRFDTTTGKLVQNSLATLSDTGLLDVPSTKTDYLDFDTSASAPAYAQGRMYWDSGNLTPSINLNADVTLQTGQEMVALVYNGTGSTITNGSVVAVSGAQGQRPRVVLADADSEALSAPTLGIATQDIANGAEGFVATFGFIRGLNTSGFTAGNPIYLSQTAGQFTATRPSAPAHTVALGWVIKSNASSGEVFVNINNGWEISELHDVLISSPVTGNVLSYDDAAGVWKNGGISGTTIENTPIGGTTPAAVTGTDVVATANLKSLNSIGDEGGEILLAKPQTNTNISGTGVTIDIYQNKLRFFEQAGTARGVYIDITAASAGVGTNLLAGGSSSPTVRTVVITDGTSITLNCDTTDIATQANTQATGTLTINAPTGTPINGQKIMLRLTSNNAQTFSWNAAFVGSTDLPLPTVSSGAGKEDYLGFIYDNTAIKWHLIAKNFGF